MAPQWGRRVRTPVPPFVRAVALGARMGFVIQKGAPPRPGANLPNWAFPTLGRLGGVEALAAALWLSTSAL
ncbi:hypothetical protein [Rhodoferax sp. PAMC 29310]|uniref:hypothetical protein n=1 Tax=Rhodoferax sp. PAMC 29310 TaxID=2822760 RepID=UPI001B33D722|nr:hypothetical protein [Rhodoferax sp. PAMC 29310]